MTERARWGALANISPARWLWIFLVLALLRGALYTFAVPPWQHPDEPTHFEHVLDIALTGKIVPENYVDLALRQQIAQSMFFHAFWKGIPQPSLDDQTLSAVGWSPIGIYTLTQPQLYYTLGALWLRPWLGLPVDYQVYLLRLFSVLLNLIVVAAACYTARLLFPEKEYLALTVTAFVVFLPGYTDDMSAVNNDVLVNVWAALFFGLIAVIYRQRWQWRTLLLLGALVTAALLTKTTALTLAAALPLVYLFYPGWRLRRKLIILLGAAALVLLAAGYVIQFEPAVYQALVAKLGLYVRVDMSATWQALFDPANLWVYYPTALVVFQSFWAVFGWRHVAIAPIFYSMLGVITGMAVLGLAVWAVRHLAKKNWGALAHWRISFLGAGAGAVVLAWLVSIVRSQAVQGNSLYFSHGRYAYVALLPFALLFVLGLRQWAPARWQRQACVALVIAMIIFDGVCFWNYLVPYYYLRAG